MSKIKKRVKLNEQFLNAYIKVDAACGEKLGLTSGGATEYINRLINTRFAPGRDEVLPRLIKYRNVRNKIAHEENALSNLDEVDKQDIKWLSAFDKSLQKKKDPISIYLRRARRYARRRKFFKRFCVVMVLLLIAAIAVAYFMTTK